MGTRERERDRDLELLIPVASISEDGASKSSTPPDTPTASHGREAFLKVIRSWVWKKFMTGCVILLPLAITFYVTWGLIHLVDGFFSPVFDHLGINIFVGVFMSSWLGASVLTLGELFIKKMPLVSYIYSASKQISSAISPVVLQKGIGEEELCCVYVPTNHLYLGDIFLISSTDILRPNISVREGIGTKLDLETQTQSE
ncbi:hypothetical protein V6N11_003998 [Hibiscus sabdariffa]|uniref:Protein LIKE COV 3 n=1 Tax=Hibiscus sabdariffa TaxID=183260 RepID=A0ABR2SEY3_9ROSI